MMLTGPPCSGRPSSCLQVHSSAFSISSCPQHIVFAVSTRSPNEDINDSETAHCQLRGSIAGTPSTGSQAAEFFFSISQQQHTQAAQASVFLADTHGNIKQLFDLADGAPLAYLCYHASAKAVVCVRSDQTMTTYSQQGDTWQVLTHMRFSAPRANAAARPAPFLCAWTGEFRCWPGIIALAAKPLVQSNMHVAAAAVHGMMMRLLTSSVACCCLET